MRGGTRPILSTLAAAAVVMLAPAPPAASPAAAPAAAFATPPPPADPSPAPPPPGPADPVAQLRESLVAQLAAIDGTPGGDGAQLAAAERALGDVQRRLTAARDQLTGINRRLSSLQQAQIDNQHTADADRRRLGELLRTEYEGSGAAGVTASVLSSTDFQQAMDRIGNARHLSAETRDTLVDLTRRRQALADDQATLDAQQTQSEAIEAELSRQSGQLMALVAQRDQALKDASSQARALDARISGLDAGSAGNTPCGDHFPYGQCTYYVATRRCVPWYGDASTWFASAQQYGFPTGSTPAPGAIAVWSPGGGGASGAGHVAYVESVGPDGSFVVSEMNWGGGWGTTSYRRVSSTSGMAGFIYQK